MRTLVVVWLLAAACSSKRTELPQPVTLEGLITANALSVSRFTPETYPVLAIANELSDNPPCWSLLVSKMTAGYQVSLASDSYFIAEGDLPRADIEACVPVTFKIGAKIKPDGDLLAVETPAGTVHVAWRGNYVVFGSRDHVLAALEQPPADTTARWQRLFGGVTRSESYVASIDGRLSPLLGASLVDWALVNDKVTRDPPLIRGRIIAHYASPADATKGAEWIRSWSGSGKFPIRIDAPEDVLAAFDALAVAVGKLKVTTTGNELVIPFDSDQMGGAEMFSIVLANLGKVDAKITGK